MNVTFAPARLASQIGTAAAAFLAMATLPVYGEPLRPGQKGAQEAVTEALQRDIYGLAAERDRLLAAAARQSPRYAPAHWHRGMVEDWRHDWVTVDEYIQRWTSLRRVKHYEDVRRQSGDTLQGQLALAEHCRREGMPEQMRAALTRVLEMAPNHEGTRRALGFVRRGPLWLGREQVEAEDALARAGEESLLKWGQRLDELARNLVSGSRARREAAGDRILMLADPSAIPALERKISPLSDQAAQTVIAMLALNPHPSASLSLARHAVYYPSLAVREEAADALSGRKLHGFVPGLLDLMVTPVASRVSVGPLPSGRIGYRHAFVRETQDRQELLVLDTEFVRIALEGGARSESRQLAAAQLRDAVLGRETETARRNELTVRLNERVAWALNRVTQQDLPASAEAWWKWWETRNQSEPAENKPLVASRQFQRQYIVDQVPDVGGEQSGDPGHQSGGGGGGSPPVGPPLPRFLSGPILLNSHCLAAGTLVWTAGGPVAVEQIERGDLVLSQGVETGELTFKPVLRTVRTKAGPTVRLTAGEETIECSGGHVFWVAGEGWTEARDLASGMLLGRAGGTAPLLSVESGADQETFNLVVADFATYFIGRERILTHDFTIRRDTSAVVPGLHQR